MAFSIVKEVSDRTHSIYDVRFYSDNINTLVTHDPDMVADWLSFTERLHRRRLDHLIVGIDTEWRPSFSRHINPVAILQICVGRRCLVYQILRAETIPNKLQEFLANQCYTFVGVGVRKDVQRLYDDYNIFVRGRIIDLGILAADVYNDNALRTVGLKNLSVIVLERDIHKPKWVTMSNWDEFWLTPVQVQYACIDAFVSFEIGRCLNASGYY